MISKIEKKHKLQLIKYMRKAFIHSEAYQECLEKALSKKKGPRGGIQYLCAECKGSFSKAKIEIDHLISLTPYRLFQYEMSEDMIWERLFCDVSNLRVLCKKPCHLANTKEQRRLRSIAKKARL